jgi:hypothetical protein
MLRRLVRTKRVREARDEAKKEISDYRASKEDEFKKFEAEVRLVPRFMCGGEASETDTVYSTAEETSRPRRKLPRRPRCKSSPSRRLDQRARRTW